ncbi:carboxymuconolactone decarboxylase family protein [Streptomyces sp. 549]|uniref:carboxymuconolactone decarboxylase family protein n=1 Tax=Streptomyces sp. 549 TaxID=3049076 RepID=UPI0024C2F6E3|nr:carboxymuconolactone decarboxylase family protein [Streptomyces sp. 549]MDK1476200.1 carboxymuconolactone decarboxylase family protein [Streptomyces sp. 549]
MTSPDVSRVDFPKAAPKVYRALIALDAAASEGLEPTLVELVRIRASQLNGCAYCVHMHTTDARKAGESEERLNLVAVWQEAGAFFTERERAVLALTEAVTLLPRAGVPDDVYRRAAAHFDEASIAQLIASILAINAWNRLAVSTGRVPGDD